MELTLISLHPPHVQMLSRSPTTRDSPVFSSVEFESWLNRTGTQILYLDGPDSKSKVQAAEQICLDWVAMRQAQGKYKPRFFSFSFSSRDPSRNSIGAMLGASFLHFLTSTSTMDNSNLNHYCLIEDQYKLQNAWMDEDMIKLIHSSYAWMKQSTPFLLLNLDECDVHGREAFWALLGDIASKTEERVKIIVTSKKTWALREELRKWPDLHVHKYTLHATEGSDGIQHGEYPTSLIPALCPRQLGEGRVRKSLKSLESMNRVVLHKVIHLIELYSRWPVEMQSDNLSLFCSLIEDISPSWTPEMLLSKILRSMPDQEFLRWLLSWTLCGKRPLSGWELSMLLYYSRRGLAQGVSSTTDLDIQACLEEVSSLLRGFVDLHDNQVYIHPDILDLMNDEDTVCGKVKAAAPEATAMFLLEYLGSIEIQKRLNDLYCQYEARVEASGDDITPPMVPDGREAVFYAVEALPHHLSSIEIPEGVQNEMKDPSGLYGPWAKVYWAMSNPFSRAANGPMKSAWATWEAAPESGSRPNMVRKNAIDEDDNSELTTHVIENFQQLGMEKLTEAVRAGNEDLALHFADQLIVNFKTQHQPGLPGSNESRRIPWSSSILWRATWLNMHRLMERLLDIGMPPDDQSSAHSPSPLHMATTLGHSHIFKMLLLHEADISVKKYDEFTLLYLACARGHADIVMALVSKDRSQLEIPHPQRPLYTASAWGSWEAVESLLKLQADPNLPMQATLPEDNDWTPLAVACDSGHVKTVRLLLEHGAEPNSKGPWKGLTPLRFATVRSESLDCIQLLLEHKADPNHELLEPPISHVIIRMIKMPAEVKIDMFEILISNDPPVLLENANSLGETPLMIAAHMGDLAAVRWLLAHGANINAFDNANCHSLFHAVERKHRPVVDELLTHHEKPLLDVISAYDWTLLSTALQDIELVKTLLDAGANPNFEDKRHRTILNHAVLEEKIDVVKMVLEPGRNVDIHHRAGDGWSPILDATGYKPNAEITRCLMESGARLSDTTPNENSPLHLAAANLRPDILRILLEFRVPDDLERRTSLGWTPLLAIEEYESPESLECIRLLVRAGSDVNAQNVNGHSILIFCSWPPEGEGAIAVLDFLLALPQININLLSNQCGTALHHACGAGNVDMVTILLEHDGIDPNVSYPAFAGTPLIQACFPDTNNSKPVDKALDKAERIVRDLVFHGANVDAAAGPVIFNALCAASLAAGVGTVNYLLDKSALLRTPDPLGRLPIHFAAGNGIQNFEAVALVYGDDIMVHDYFNKNVLHWAAQFGHVKTVRTILQRLSPKQRRDYINCGDVDGWTPLAWASRPTDITSQSFYWIMSEPQDYPATIQCLTDYGADVSAEFLVGQGEAAEVFTPLKLAKQCSAEEDAIRLLTPDEDTNNNGRKVEGDGNVASEKEPRYKKNLEWTCDLCFSVSLFSRCVLNHFTQRSTLFSWTSCGL